jgi:hypothetical protein
MYHVGKVVEIISPAKEKKIKSADKTIQAVVRMWDENLLILEVSRKIALSLLPGDYVIADYSPLGPTSPYRKMLVTKVLPREKGKKIWTEFQKELSRKKSALAQMQASGGVPGYR